MKHHEFMDISKHLNDKVLEQVKLVSQLTDNAGEDIILMMLLATKCIERAAGIASVVKHGGVDAKHVRRYSIVMLQTLLKCVEDDKLTLAEEIRKGFKK